MLSTLISVMIAFASPKTLPVQGDSSVVLASHTMSLDDRYNNQFVNDVFKDNILLTLKYMDGEVKSASDIKWENVEKDFTYSFTLKPGERFVFHDKMIPVYADHVAATTHAHFNYSDGFKSDGYLTGDGVCHLASFMNWVAKDADLDSYGPSNHDFAKIPDIDAKYGVAIYANPNGEGAYQNLYITNNREKPVTFVFDYKNDNLSLSIKE